MKVRLRTKLLLSTQIAITLIFGSFIIYNGAKLKTNTKTNTIQLVEAYTEKYALLCKNYLDTDMGFTKALANSLENLTRYDSSNRDSIFGHIMLKMLENNNKYISVWNTIELSFIDKEWHDNYGRKSLVTLRNGSTIQIMEIFKNMNGDDTASAYYSMKINQTPAVMEPYIDPDVGNFLITSITTPIIIDNKFAGLGGVDIPLNVMQEFIDKMELITQGEQAMVLSNKGVVVAHSDKEKVGKQLHELKGNYASSTEMIDSLQQGKSLKLEHQVNKLEFYTCMIPFYIDGTKTPWAFTITLPLEKILHAAQVKNRKILWLGIVGILLFFVIIWLIGNYIVNPLTRTTETFKELAKGNIDNNLRLTIKTGDELQELGDSVNNLMSSLHNTVKFAKEIQNGNFEAEYKLLSKEDNLGVALLDMRDGLAETKNLDKIRREEDENRNWSSKGIALLGDILRKPSTNIGALLQELIVKLVSYSNANLCGVFLINEDNPNDPFIEKVASIAYAEEKLEENRIEIGEGLVGTAIKENKSAHFTNLTNNYLNISSGLGSIKPTSLVIIPICSNNKCIGAIELASLTKFKEHHLEFFENISENIGSTISSVRLNIQTNLLLEKTQQQAEEMMAQEEELRQNMEEMLATQEESTNRIEDLEKQLAQKVNI